MVFYNMCSDWYSEVSKEFTDAIFTVTELVSEEQGGNKRGKLRGLVFQNPAT